MYTPLPKPTNATDVRKSHMWNCWARTSRDRGGDGVITHVFEEGSDLAKEGRSICGVRTYDSGLLNMYDDDYIPGCIRCKNILRKAGLLPPKVGKYQNPK